MIKYVFAISMLLLMCLNNAVFATDALTETRYCGEPKRYANGRIARSVTVVREFERRYPLPAQYNRDDWQIDHVWPLSEGGCDSISNMQWLPKSIKTCSDDACKDRWERKGIYKP